MNWLENLRRSFLDWNAMAEVLPTMITVGLKNTLILAATSTVLGVAIGMMLAIMGISRSPWLRIPARLYTDIFRGLRPSSQFSSLARVLPALAASSSVHRLIRSAFWHSA